MLYCAKSRTESLRGPSTCDSVHCTRGHLCMVKVHQCHWDQKCKQQIARCVSLQEYHESPASCAGFKCPQGNHCILRESFCVNPPCKLLRSCSKNKEVHVWFNKCRSLGCPSQFECFLRRPENTCPNPPCKHTPDCVNTTETATPCQSNNCSIIRTCIMIPQNMSTSFSKRFLRNENIDVRTPEDNSEQFQDWLRSIRDILGPSAYAGWIEETLASRGEEFRKWLRAFHVHGPHEDDKPDGEHTESIFPERVRPQNEPARDSTENQYPVYDTSNGPSQDDLNEMTTEINTMLRDRNLTNMIEEHLVPKKTIVLAYSDLETDLFNYLKKKGDNLSYQLPDSKNSDGQPLYAIPIKNTETPASDMINQNTDSGHSLQNQLAIISQNSELSHGQMDLSFNVPEILTDLFTTKDMSPSLWSGFDTHKQKASFKTESSTRNSDGVSKNKIFFDTEQYIDNVPADLLETLIKSLSISSIENVQGSSDEISVEQKHQNSNQNHISSTVTDISGYEHPFMSKNSKEVADQFPSYLDARIDFTNNSESRIGSDFLQKLNITMSFNHSNRENNSHIEMPINQKIDESNKDFFELNKETLFPYIQTLIEAIDEENDSWNESERNVKESSINNIFMKILRDVETISEEPLETKPKNIITTKELLHRKIISHDLEGITELSISGDNFDDIVQNRVKQALSKTNLQPQEQNPKTLDTIYENEEPKYRSSYGLASYGASHDDRDPVENHKKNVYT
ncbi:hypothetical protein WN55_00367 [Dufourea novaeangliae]|uniref:Uncharacterized protein n=1 Tax=Dufourea novaeangliae TaxID=178035 RepID=A0A154PFK2_DUFNO|nr:hypothetical protein WN55_00367 [Dufourea novaeangliae]